MSPIDDRAAPNAAYAAAHRNLRSMMNTAIAPSTMPTRTAPSPSVFSPSYTSPAFVSASAPAWSADVPAAASALSINPVPHAAMFGTMASTIAA